MRDLYDFRRLIPDTPYGRDHLLRYCHSARWIEPLMGQIDVLELGAPSPFSDLIRSAWPTARWESTGNLDLREPWFEEGALESTYASNSFDLALCMEVLEHIKDSERAVRHEFAGDGIATMLQEAFRVLRPGGHLFVSTPNLACWHSLLRLVDGHHPFFFAPHNREMTWDEVGGYLTAAGFAIEKAGTLDVWRQHDSPPERIRRLRAAVARLGCGELSRGDCLFCMARKP